MNRRSLILAGIAIASFAAAATQGVLLRRELKEGTTEVYTLKTEMKQTVDVGGMQQDLGINSSAKLTLKTGKIDPADGTAEVETIVSDMKTEADGAAAMMANDTEMPKEVKATGKLDARNRLMMKATKATGMMEMMMGASSPASSLSFVEFPDKEINVGDTWTVTVSKSPAYGNKEQTLIAKLMGDRDRVGGKVWVISVSGTLNLDMDMTEMMKDMPNNPMAGQKTTLKGTVELKGIALVDKTTGKTLEYTTDSISKNTVNLVDAGMTVESNGTVKTTLTLQK
jgi:hypothetical protein